MNKLTKQEAEEINNVIDMVRNICTKASCCYKCPLQREVDTGFKCIFNHNIPADFDHIAKENYHE